MKITEGKIYLIYDNLQVEHETKYNSKGRYFDQGKKPEVQYILCKRFLPQNNDKFASLNG